MGAYLKFTRLLHARQLLLSTDKPIEYIANEVGFSSSRVLNRNFKNWKHKNTNSVSK
nr:MULTISPECIES: helix-turn-helix domain-containing protein [Lactobacillus]